MREHSAIASPATGIITMKKKKAGAVAGVGTGGRCGGRNKKDHDQASPEPVDLDTEKQLAYIDQMLTDAVRERPEMVLAPSVLALLGMIAGAGLFAAGAGFMKLFG
jgi:hypothetical protein